MITPIIVCGGSGTRLWPLSRKSYPKQFVPLVGDTTLFQSSVQRFATADYLSPLIITNSDFRFIVAEQLTELGIDPGAILIEPEARNTAPAILAAAMWLERTDPNGLMVVAPSDQVVPDAAAFRDAVESGVDAAKSGKIVTFGIGPTHAETGYGYLELGVKSEQIGHEPLPLKRFVEKPDAETATDMFNAGNFLWNAGVFLFSVKTILAAFDDLAPDLVAAVRASIEKGKPDLGFMRLNPEEWSKANNISIDYAIMERSDNLVVVPFKKGWSDLGGWDAVWRESDQDAQGVALSGNATAIDCQDTLLRSEDDGLEIVGIGLNNIVAVAMPDAVLIADKDRSQEVKFAVDALKRKNALQATAFPKDHRPWGWFESLIIGDRFQVKRIYVHPGAALSLQSHHHRSEHWVVVEGTAKITIDATESLVSENQSVYIPLGALHRMENPGKVPMVLIEVQTGTYLGEDDIIRYEDAYARR